MKQFRTKAFLAILTLISSTLYSNSFKEVPLLHQNFDPIQRLITLLKKNPISIGEAALCLALDYLDPDSIKEYTQAQLNNPLIATLCVSFANLFASDFLYKAYDHTSLTPRCIGRFFMLTLLNNPVTTAQQALYWFGDATGTDYRSKMLKTLKDHDDSVTTHTLEWGWYFRIPAKIIQSPPLILAANVTTSILIARYFITTPYDDCVLSK